jgi:hypothetical protein
VNDYASLLVRRHGRAAVFFDTNILLLLVVGFYDRQLISQFKRTLSYTPEDYDLVDAFVGEFENIVTTSSVLTEVSNLAGQLNCALRSRCFEVFAAILSCWMSETSRVQPLPDCLNSRASDSLTPRFCKSPLGQ